MEKNNIYIFLITVVICLSSLWMFLFFISHDLPQLKSYKANEDSTYQVEKISDEEFLKAVEHASAENITAMLKEQGANINAVDSNKRNAVSIATMFNRHQNVLKVLKELGADINHSDQNGYTPLMLSILSSSSKESTKAQELILLGANTNGLTRSGVSTLMLAVSVTDNIGLIKLLLAKGANINYQDPQGVTPLMMAAQSSHNPRIIKLLINKGANVDLVDNLQITAYDIIKSNIYLKNHQSIINLIKSNSKS